MSKRFKDFLKFENKLIKNFNEDALAGLVCARVVLSECCCKDRERERERACARAIEREREAVKMEREREEREKEERF